MKSMSQFSIRSLQDRLAQSTPVEDNIETNLLVQVEQVDVQSAPSEISSLEIQVSDIQFVFVLPFRILSTLVKALFSCS